MSFLVPQIGYLCVLFNNEVSKLGPLLRRIIETQNMAPVSLAVGQVRVFLMWVQWLWAVPLRGREVVCLNIDETPVYRQMQPRKGYVIMLSKKCDRSCYARVPLRDRRGQSTLLGAVVDIPELQKHIPQFLLTKDNAMTRAEKATLRALPLPMHWVPESKGWISADVLKKLLTKLRKAIRDLRPRAEILLYMDCATVHTSEDVLVHCSRLGMHVCLIPGGMTSLCQPLDTHVFGTYKRILSELQEDKRADHPLGIMPPGAWIEPVVQSTQQVLVDRSWSSSFSENALHADPSVARPRLRDIAELDHPLPIRLPTPAELSMLLGRHREGLGDVVYRASRRLAEHPLVLMPMPRARLPPARAPLGPLPRGASSSSGHAMPPLPPPAEPPPDDDVPVRRTRSGLQY